jgi:hypothetical protein
MMYRLLANDEQTVSREESLNAEEREFMACVLEDIRGRNSNITKSEDDNPEPKETES